MPGPAFDYGGMDFEVEVPERRAPAADGDVRPDPPRDPGFGSPERRGLPFDPREYYGAPFGTPDRGSSHFHPFFGFFWRFGHHLEPRHGWSQDRNFVGAPFGRGAGWFDMPCARFYNGIAGDAPDWPKFEWRKWCKTRDKRNRAPPMEEKVKLEFL